MGRAVPRGEKRLDAADQLTNGLEVAPAEGQPSDQPEPDFHLIEPRAVSRRLTGFVARVSCEPRAHGCVLVRRSCRESGAQLARRDDVTLLHIERGEEGRRTLAEVVVADTFDVAQAHGDHRSGSLEGSNLALFVVLMFVKIAAQRAKHCTFREAQPLRPEALTTSRMSRADLNRLMYQSLRTLHSVTVTRGSHAPSPGCFPFNGYSLLASLSM